MKKLIYIEDDESISKRKPVLNMVIDNFWNRWRHEYVTGLREVQRRTDKQGGEEIQVGDIVIIYDEKCPRHLWRIAKVEKLIKGNDSKIRGAVLKIGKTGSIIKRPVNKLYPFVQRKFENYSVTNSRKSTECKVDKLHVNDDVSSYENINEFELNHPQNANGVRLRREAAIIGEFRRRELFN